MGNLLDSADIFEQIACAEQPRERFERHKNIDRARHHRRDQRVYGAKPALRPRKATIHLDKLPHRFVIGLLHDQLLLMKEADLLPQPVI